MLKLTEGMAHYYDQQKDRDNWEKAMRERTALIKELTRLGVKFEQDPNAMKLVTLRKMWKKVQK